MYRVRQKEQTINSGNLTASGVRITCDRIATKCRYVKSEDIGLSAEQQQYLSDRVDEITDANCRVMDAKFNAIQVLVEFGELHKDIEETDDIIKSIFAAQTTEKVDAIRAKILGGHLDIDCKQYAEVTRGATKRGIQKSDG